MAINGSFEWFCSPLNVVQEAPDGVPLYALWHNEGHIAYTGSLTAADTQYGHNPAVGPVAQGFTEYAAKVRLPCDISGARILYPGTTPIIPSQIPANAKIWRIGVRLRCQSQPSNWLYTISEVGHDNAFLPAINATDFPDDPPYVDGDIPPAVGTWTTLAINYNIDPDVTPIFMSDVASQALTNFWFVIKHKSGESPPDATPIVQVLFARLFINFEVDDATDMVASSSISGSASPSIQRVGDLSTVGAAAMTLAGTGVINTKGALSAAPQIALSGIGDISTSASYIDNTAAAGISLSSSAEIAMTRNLGASPSIEMSGVASLDHMNALGAEMAFSLSPSALLVKDGMLTVNDIGCRLVGALTATIQRRRNMVAAASFSLSGSAGINGKLAVAGSPSITLSVAGSQQKIMQLESTDALLEMSTSAVILRNVPIAGAASLEVSSPNAEITFVYESDALPENTIRFSPPDRTVYVPPRPHEAVVAGQQRN